MTPLKRHSAAGWASPLSFDEVVHEIVACSDVPYETVRAKLWQQITGPGNVPTDAPRFGVTPNVYDDAMRRLYDESTGFIFETMLFGQRLQRQGWRVAALARIDAHAERLKCSRQDLKILMFGDGCGEDSLALVRAGCRVDYFDLPGSRTFAFACRRFQHHEVGSSTIRIITETSALVDDHYDVVISFEVLEHLPQPNRGIEEMARVLKPGGIALVSDAFELVTPAVPTHLASNYVYRDTTAYLCLRAGLHFTWTNRTDWNKPMEVRKVGGSRLQRYVHAITNGGIRKALFLLVRRGRFGDVLMPRNPASRSV